MPVALLAQGPNVRIGALGNILVSVFDGPPDEKTLEVVDRGTSLHAASHAKYVSIVAIVAEKLAAPTPQFREGATKLHARFEDQLLASATVITSRGMAAVVARTFLAAYQLIVHYKAPQQTFRDLPTAVAWLEQQVSEVKGVRTVEQLEAFCAAKP